MNILIQSALISIGSCMNYGGYPYLSQSHQYIGCWVNKPIYSLVMADLKDRRQVFTTGKP